MGSLRGCCAAVLVAGWASSALAQPPAMSPELKTALSLFQAQKWTEAAAAYEAIVKTDRTDPRPRAGLAASLYAMGEFRKALPFAMQANTMLEDPKIQMQYPGLPRGAVMLRIARIHNRLGETDEALAWLQKAVNFPLPNPQSLETEADMANLRADARWKNVRDALKASIDPCNSRPEFRQFDFWVGDWEVFGASGQKVGFSRVERILNNCVIFETYRAVPGSAASPDYVGQAFHFFDRTSNGWVQHYIDSVAGPFDWTGELREGAMRYVREGPFGPNGRNVKQRMTFTSLPDGRVRQVFEQSIDDGKSWQSGFDGTYVRSPGRSGAADPAPAAGEPVALGPGDPDRGHPDGSRNSVTSAVRQLLPEHRRRIIGSFAMMPEDKYGFRPTPELMTFGELAVHIASAHDYYCRILAPVPSERAALPTSTAPKKELVAAVERSFDYCWGVVGDLRDSGLSDPLSVSGRPQTRALILVRLISGMDHHYAQAAGYLRLNGLAPPTAIKER